MAKQILYFVPPNSKLPSGVSFNTIRLGDKWAKQAKVGEVIELRETGTERQLGDAAVVNAVCVVLDRALGEYAERNHAGLGLTGQIAVDEVAASLRAAYGDLTLATQMTVLTIVPLLAA